MDLNLGAVVSGIALTRGICGPRNFGWHHRFVWPALGLLVALAVWRLLVAGAVRAELRWTLTWNLLELTARLGTRGASTSLTD
jgi:hypothetical protein